MMKAVTDSLTTNFPNITLEDVQTANSLRLKELCAMATEKLPRRQRKFEVRWTEWMVTTAIRELQQALAEQHPERKRKQNPPKRVERRKRIKRIEIK